MKVRMAESGNLVVTALVGLAGALLGAVGNAATGWFTYASKGEEVRVRLVEIALTILREKVTPAREWAMKVIERNSRVEFRASACPQPASRLHQGRVAVQPPADARSRW